MNVLVTRPRGKGESLVQLLRPLVSSVHYQPMLEIQPGPDFDALPETNKKVIIDGIKKHWDAIWKTVNQTEE